MGNFWKNIGNIITPKFVKNTTGMVEKISDNKTKNTKIKLLLIALALILLGLGAIKPEIFETLLNTLFN